MKDYLIEFFSEFNYPEEASKELFDTFCDIEKKPLCKERFEMLIGEYTEGRLPSYNEIKDTCTYISEATGRHQYTLELLYFICISKHLLVLYKEKGLSREIWHNTMIDLWCKLIECHLVKGVWGCFVADWFIGFFKLTRFALGRLQFELLPFGHSFRGQETELNGVMLRDDTVTINVHIPRTETPLDKDSCDKAYAAAVEFFKDDLNTDGCAVFMCHSWLLYPENNRLLNEKSNIRRFMSEYTILRTEDDKGTYGEMWRLFDMDYTGNFADYPENSSARRAYKAHLMNGGKVGIGVGVKIVKFDN